MSPTPKMHDHMPLLVAYAEEQTSYRQCIKASLEASGRFKVIVEAPNGKKLIESIEKLDRPPDLCIFEIRMDEMNGYETQVCIKEKWPEMKTLVLSALKDDYCIQNMVDTGASGYLTKDSSLEEIIQGLHQLAEEGHCYPASYLKQVLRYALGKQKKSAHLSQREYTFLKHCGTDYSYKQIADLMGCSENSVNGYRDSLFRKVGASNRIGLVLFGFRTGLVNM